MSNILVTGGSGQVGSDIKLLSDNNYFFPSSVDLDIRKKKFIKDFINQNHIDFILNFAAYTKVDKAEKFKKIANDINFKGALNLAIEASKNDIGIIHFSTDYVFGGNKKGINFTNDKVSPVNHYGLTKSLGEQAVLKNCSLGFIVRLASVYGQFGDNFIKTMIRLLLTSQEVRVIHDQMISMTGSEELSNNLPYLIDLYNKKISDSKKGCRIIHFTNKGYTSWYKVAKIIKSEMEINLDKKLNVKLVPIKSRDWESLALRPADSRLKVNFKELERNKIFLPKWDISIRKFVKKILPSTLSELGIK